MSNEFRSGHPVTPLVLWVTGGLGGVIAAIGLTMLWRIDDKQDVMAADVAMIKANQQHVGSDIDDIQADVNSVQTEVRGLSDRVGKLEARK